MTRETAKIILHVEDEPAHATIVRMAIQRHFSDVRLRQIDDGKGALDYLYQRGSYEDPTKSPRPDLILLDLRMPRISGLEFLAIVKKDSVLKAIPVVILTTSDLVKDRADANTYGADGYLIKSGDFDEFVKVLDELCAAWL